MPGSILRGLLVCLASAPILLPFGAWLAGGLSEGSFARGWPPAEGWMLFARSAALAAGTALAAGLLGLLGALRLLSTLAGRPWRLGLLLAALLVAPAIQGLGWSALAAQGGAWMRILDLPAVPFQGVPAALWVNAVAHGPLATVLVAAALLQVDPSLLEAGRLHRSEDAVLARLLPGLAAPFLLAGGGFLFLWLLQDFTVPSLFSVTTYPMGLFARLAVERDPAALLAQSAPLLALAIPLALAGMHAGRIARNPRFGGPAPALGGLNPFARRPFLALLADLWILLPWIAPLLLLVLGGNARGLTALGRALPDLGYGAGLGFAVAVLATLAGAVLGRHLAGKGMGWGFLGAAVLAPFVLPSVFPALGALRLAQALPPAWEEAAPVLAALARALPLATAFFLVAFRQEDPALRDAARLLVRSPWTRFWHLRLPALAPAAALAFALSFALTLGECAAMILVLPPGRGTLATRLFNLLHYGASPDAAALALALSLAAGLAALLAAWAFRRTTRWSQHP